MAEEFNLKKLMQSPFSPLYWTKTVMFMAGAFIILMIGFAVYKAYFKRAEPSQLIRAAKGSTVTVVQNNERKKTLIPFIEAGLEQPSNNDWNTYIRGGVRFEW